MPALLDVRLEDSEQALQTMSLPLPVIDLGLAEYARTLCKLLDMPIYENPVESLHQMFVLFIDFKNKTHLNAHKSKHQ
jgi:intraflagellar transport protein 46